MHANMYINFLEKYLIGFSVEIVITSVLGTITHEIS